MAAVLGAGVDGFVVYSVGGDYTAESVLRRRLPVVVSTSPKTSECQVGIDDRAAMREAAGYVPRVRHRELGQH